MNWEGDQIRRVPEELRSPEAAYYHRRKGRLADSPPTVPQTKICGRCKQAKPAESFGVARARLDGLQPWCKSCQRDYQRSNREAANERSRRFRRRNPEAGARYLREAREQAIHHYSTTTVPSCSCCGETEPAFLVLDHVNGGGNPERRAFGRALFVRLRARGYPDGYQVLCWNCNAAKAYQGICPHQVGKQVPLCAS